MPPPVDGLPVAAAICEAACEVTSGILFFLVAWAVYLAQPLALLGPLAFALYVTRFQILHEERVLAGLFGREFAAYSVRVRRCP